MGATPDPDFESVLPRNGKVTVDATAVAEWDSSLMLYALNLQAACQKQGLLWDFALPKGGEALLGLAQEGLAQERPSPSAPRAEGLTERWLHVAEKVGAEVHHLLEFLGALASALIRFITGRARTRWKDIVEFAIDSGPSALPIIGLSSVLVGMIVGYLGAVQLQEFGAGIYIADIVTIGMLREMGPLMTAIIMAGRTGAAYAARLGTMNANEEIDAIQILGIQPIEFLVLPRVIALVCALPILVLYTNLLGILGGAIVAMGLDITPLQYFTQVGSSLGLDHLYVGLFKAGLFATLIAIAGCRAGIRAGRNSEGVGKATTQAVVIALLYLIVADATVNIICQLLGL